MSRSLSGCFGLAVIILTISHTVNAGNNGAARLPPLGWRSWNYYACEIDHTVFERQIVALTDRSRSVEGKPNVSLADLGYDTVGIDDCWQDCLSESSFNGSYHTAKGVPLVDATRFPDGLAALSTFGAAHGIKLGWYGNNCPETSGAGRGAKYCSEYKKLQSNWPAALVGDVAALIEYNFSAIKLDNPRCGAGSDMQAYYDLVNKTSHRPIEIENCHYNTTFPFWIDEPGGELACPMSFFRVSNDIKANWGSVLSNALQTIPYADDVHPMSTPGCWAYPDMLEVGVTGQNGHSEGGLSLIEQRTHFGLWCVISSPLTLSFDVGNATLTSQMWSIITNTEALAVSQSWYGHPGTLRHEDKGDIQFQIWSKIQANGAVAVLVINTSPSTNTLSLHISNYIAATSAHVRDIWNHADSGVKTGEITFESVASHDSIFLLLRPTTTPSG